MKSRIQIQREDFDIGAELDALTGGTDAGAVCSFTGHVRREGDLSVLTLEHYPHMTEAEIARLIDQAALRWPLLAVTVLHRVGSLVPGARIVLVAVAASHRRAAFEACEFLIDFLKTHAPFWKEEARGGERHWVAARDSDEQAASRWRKE
jgi:molybdopterin synthase catalytic subunit